MEFNFFYSCLVYLIFFFTVLFLLFLSDHCINKNIKKILWILVNIIFFFIIGFRNMGIDRDSYIYMYNAVPIYINDLELALASMEPGYLLLNFFVYYCLGDFIYIQIFQALLFSISAYKIMEYADSKHYSLVIIFSFTLTTIFFYIMGLIRISISISIFIISILNFIKKKQKRNLCIGFIISSMFHYSAICIIFILFYVFIVSKNNYNDKKIISQIISFVVIIFVFINIISPYLLNIVSYKYIGYLNNFGFHWSSIINIIYVLPLILFCTIFWKKIVHFIDIRLVAVVILVTIISTTFVGSFRFIFFINYLIGYMYALFFNKIKVNLIKFKLLLKAIYIILLVIYAYITFFDSIYITPFIIPFGIL